VGGDVKRGDILKVYFYPTIRKILSLFQKVGLAGYVFFPATLLTERHAKISLRRDRPAVGELQSLRIGVSVQSPRILALI
jgi:hypothetical protein